MQKPQNIMYHIHIDINGKKALKLPTLSCNLPPGCKRWGVEKGVYTYDCARRFFSD